MRAGVWKVPAVCSLLSFFFFFWFVRGSHRLQLALVLVPKGNNFSLMVKRNPMALKHCFLS